MLLRKVVSVVALISADCRSVRMSELRVLLTAPPEATGLVIRHQTFQWPRGPSSLKGCSLEDHTSAPMQARSYLNCRPDLLQLNSILPFSAHVLFRRRYRILNVTPELELSFRLSLSLLCCLLKNLTLRRRSLLAASTKQLFSTRRHATQSWYRLAAQTQHADSKGRSPVRTEAPRQNKGC